MGGMEEYKLCTDHFGHGMMTAKEVIRLGHAVEPYGLAWLEDPMPWWDIEGHKRVTDAINVPTAAGEAVISPTAAGTTNYRKG